jgi:hypothetical protein
MTGDFSGYNPEQLQEFINCFGVAYRAVNHKIEEFSTLVQEKIGTMSAAERLSLPPARIVVPGSDEVNLTRKKFRATAANFPPLPGEPLPQPPED